MRFEEIYFAFFDYMDKGGIVLWGILAVSFYIFVLFLNRVIYLTRDAKKLEFDLTNSLSKNCIYFELLRLEYIARKEFYKYHALIKVSIFMLPLLGLLGTVTGMIEVFETMAMFGNSNPRLMASGVAKAIIPTMTGMALAIFCLITLYFIKVYANKLMRTTVKKLQELYSETI
jgi:biopolymer transport protein ExbB